MHLHLEVKFCEVAIQSLVLLLIYCRKLKHTSESLVGIKSCTIGCGSFENSSI